MGEEIVCTAGRAAAARGGVGSAIVPCPLCALPRLLTHLPNHVSPFAQEELEGVKAQQLEVEAQAQVGAATLAALCLLVPAAYCQGWAAGWHALALPHPIVESF